MIVVADTSPVNYLVLIDEIDLLPIIFGKVLIPEAVMEELQHPRTPPKVRQWIVNLASWIEVRCSLSAGNTDLMGLDIGNATRSSRSNWEWTRFLWTMQPGVARQRDSTSTYGGRWGSSSVALDCARLTFAAR